MNDRRVIVAFFTGQSDPGNDALSPQQRHFLAVSPAAPHELLPSNFPYTGGPAGHRAVPLWRASLNNGLQYLRSRNVAFSVKHRSSILEKFSAYDRVIFVTGSCGLELLVNLRLPEEFMKRVHVFALGPVSRSLPECRLLRLVQGDRDYLSKLWHCHPHHVVRCQHMNYLESPETQLLFRKFYQEVTSNHAPD